MSKYRKAKHESTSLGKSHVILHIYYLDSTDDGRLLPSFPGELKQ
jgi:hypothetical protein